MCLWKLAKFFQIGIILPAGQKSVFYKGIIFVVSLLLGKDETGDFHDSAHDLSLLKVILWRLTLFITENSPLEMFSDLRLASFR